MVEISVIIPVYNVEDKLKRCLDSIKEQSFQDFEVLLIDDGSEDSSGRICDEYVNSDSRFQVFHLDNGGVSCARNYGLKKAKGNYVAFVDSDDYVEKEYLQVLYANAIKAKADIVMCGYYLYSVTVATAQERIHTFSEGETIEHPTLQKVLYENIVKCETEGYFSLCNKLFSNVFIRSNDIRLREDMSFGEDMIFIMDSLKCCQKISFTRQCLYNYELGVSGLFSSYRPSFFQDIMICYERMIEQTADFNQIDPNFLELNFKYYYYVNRHLQGIIHNERNRKKKIRHIYRNKTVQQIFERVARIDEQEIKKRNIEEYELKIPRWVAEGKIRRATNKTIYIFDENCLMRKCRRLIDCLTKRSKNGKSKI